MDSETSQIAIGWTDGSRFVAIKPPLNDNELHILRDKNLVRGAVEQIDLDPACTQISFSSSHATPESATRRAQGIAVAIAEALRATRQRKIGVNLTPVGLGGFKSSPFNSDTDAVRHQVS